ncbi:phosphoglucomutase [Blastomyces dermatitidis ER-3]|uniref:Phosphoglucomutase n=1 Tax=Ajellomyces dermatitidis (strain ER-3 / ATCC MYA-2586) TaxID=559297 RepID=A0ABP2F5D4_AJEDR|nr:phosphoglucomutase [Blastomyces dermatitidis ER-3]EEQ91414.1 phosphoglucomutase [Blastomyces dermatitidis ER-3]
MADSSTIPLSDLVQQWLDWDHDPKTRAEILRLRDEKNVAELEKRLRKRIEFGTAGLRGRMQAGFSSMNGLTVIQASQGLAKYIKMSYQQSSSQESEQPPSVIIGRDARYNSKQFAMLAANAFAAEGIRVLWYQNAGPTPLVPFGVLKNPGAWGVMVTASHNPARDNGYKVYASNGCQINSPMDMEIAEIIGENLEPWPNAWDTTDESKYLALDCYEDTAKIYCDAVTQFVNSIKLAPGSPPRPFVYTPLHGVGNSIMSRLCEQLGIKDLITVVAEQQEPDPDFPTVTFPNPEESGALDLAMKTADAVGRDLIIANDPDADRLAVVEKVNGTWKKLTGDQLGILLASYMLDTITSQQQQGQHTRKKIAMLTTAVSTSMLSKFARAESFHAQETLTGFKWLGNVARRLESSTPPPPPPPPPVPVPVPVAVAVPSANSDSETGYTVPFAFEEALGYMFPAISYDKDGLTAALVFAAAAEPHWRINEGVTPYEKLTQLYARYGYFENLNTYFVSPDVGVTRKLFEGVRERVAGTGLGLGLGLESGKEMEMGMGMVGSLPILRWRDVTLGFDSGPTGKGEGEGEGEGEQLPADPNSQMVTVWSERGIRFTLRGSGTEPKIKIYIESCSASRDDAVKAICDAFMAVLEDWIRPCAPGVACAERIVTSSGFVFDVPR